MIEYELICQKCHRPYKLKLLESQYKSGKYSHYCSSYCSHSHIHTDCIKNKISKTILENLNSQKHKKCKCCNKEFISVNQELYCPICYLKRKDSTIKLYECELRKSKCLKCHKELYTKINVDYYCDKCCQELNIQYHNMYDINGNVIQTSKISDKIREHVKNGTHKGWVSRNIISYPEKFFMKVLENNKIEYKHNFPIKKTNLGSKNQNCYFLDFLLENKFDLEIDGDQHKYRQQSDLVRDELLIKNGYFVYRIKWNEINTENGKKIMKQKIDDFLKTYRNYIK